MIHNGQSTLWERVQDYSPDDHESSFTFTMRLARENNWSLAYADRVVYEYKRFMFLATSCDHVVTPSEQVDQAWHLHMVYTRSYWDDFCGKVLKKPIHHGPTKGGKPEQEKFIDLYELTLNSYREVFGEHPPADIWPNVQERFAKGSIHQRIDRKDYWVIRKPDFSKLYSIEAAQLSVAAITPVLLIGWSPYQLSGKPFLVFYALLTIATFGLVFGLQRWLVSDGSSKWERYKSKSKGFSTDHWAYLAGGSSRLLQSGLSELLVGRQAKAFRQQLQLGDAKGKPVVPKSKIAQRILAKLQSKPHDNLDFAAIKQSTKLDVARISGQLVDAGLIQPRTKRYSIACLSVLVMSGVLVVGVIRIIQALENSKPFDFLIIEMAFALIATIAIPVFVPRRTHLGNKILASKTDPMKLEKMNHLTEKSSPLEVAMMVGLFGPTLLCNTAFDGFDKDIKHVLTGPIDASGGGGCGADGGCGGGGCGGGGCGGCGD